MIYQFTTVTKDREYRKTNRHKQSRREAAMMTIDQHDWTELLSEETRERLLTFRNKEAQKQVK